MRRWQFDLLFVVAVGGLVAMLFVEEPPATVVTGLTAVLTFVLAQRPDWTHRDGDSRTHERRPGKGGGDA